MRFHTIQVLRIPGIGELIEVHNVIRRMLFQHMPYEIASNEPATAGDENSHLLSVIRIRGQKKRI